MGGKREEDAKRQRSNQNDDCMSWRNTTSEVRSDALCGQERKDRQTKSEAACVIQIPLQY